MAGRLLRVDPATGDITVAGELDREAVQWLNLSLVATDSGSPARSATVPVYIRVLDMNDNSPVVGKRVVEVAVPEDARPGTEVARLTAKDPDSGEYGRLTWALEAGPGRDMFRIDPQVTQCVAGVYSAVTDIRDKLCEINKTSKMVEVFH